MRGFSLAIAVALVGGLSMGASAQGPAGAGGASAQQAPQVLPYTMSTIAGPTTTALTVGSKCGNYVAMDAIGDGCPAQYVIVGSDPHDIRVDGKGNIFWEDNSSKEVVHKISAVNGVQTVYAGSAVQSKVCATGNGDKYGDGCVANDGVANSGTATYYTGSLAKIRGLAVSPNGDVYMADYTGDYDHKISAATGLMTVVAGSGSGTYANGPVGTSGVNSTRGIGVDPNTGVVYIADTANNVIRMATPVFSGSASTGYTITGYNTTTITNDYAPGNGQGSASCGALTAGGIPASNFYVCAPEDVQVDLNGNVYIVDFQNKLIEAIYMGKGSLPGISSPQTGNIYIVAGYNATIGGTQNTYPSASASTTFYPTFPATTIALGIRKISIDTAGNIYIPDSGANVIWFVDAATGNIRLLAGNYGAAAQAAPIGCTASVDGVGDGCPGPLGSLYSSAGDPANSADNQGNLYFTDSEGEASGAPARLRKLLSGLNFGAVATASLSYTAVAQGSSLTDKVFIHFGPGDGPAASGAFVSTNSDFTVGTQTCETTPNTDNTTDCIVPVTFSPSKPGNDTSTLLITSLLGATNSYLMTGIGSSPMVAIDPGNVAVVTTSPFTTSSAQGIVLDGAGNGYIADTNNNRVLKYTSATQITTVLAGTGTAGYTGDGAQAVLATLKAPKGVAIDTGGNVYIADSGNNVIRKVNTAGVISTFAGGSAVTVCGLSVDALGDGCPATQATLSSPSGVTADNLGQVFVSDTGNNLIRQISVQGYISLLAGGAATVCSAAVDTQGDGCPGSLAIFKGPTGLAFDSTGKYLVVADTGNNIVREIYTANTWGTSGTGTSTLAAGFQANPVILAAGNGQAGGGIGATAITSSLSGPTGVAVDTAEDIYIADTGNHAIKFVSNGVLSTLVGINTVSGTGIVPGTAASAQLNSPAAVAVTQQGTLVVLDSGNNRLLTDSRSQVTYNFGTVGISTSSPQVPFAETNIGDLSTSFANPLFTTTGNGGTQITLTAPTGSTGCVASQVLAVGASCTLLGQFTPTATGTYSETYTEPAVSSAGNPSITLSAVGAVLTATSSMLAQTSPSGTAQYGQALTVTASVTASSCSTITGASCTPSGTVKFGVVANGTTTYGPAQPLTASTTAGIGTAAQTYGGGGSGALSALPAGANQLVCLYSGDSYYGSSNCSVTTITVAPATTTSLLSAAPNNQAQYPTNNCAANTPTTGQTTCTSETLTATVVSSTTGVPTGNVTFYANGSVLGCINGTAGCATTAALNPSGVATLALTYTVDSNGNLVSDSTLAPGTYQLTCQYNGASNYATSKCAAVSFTVVAQAPAFTLVGRGCAAVNLIPVGYQNAGESVGCAAGTEYRYPANSSVTAGSPEVETAQGSTTDATIFINATNSVAGTLTFSCSGLPAASNCTFSPTSITLTAGSTYAGPVYTDMTLWTDLQPGFQGSLKPGQAGVMQPPNFRNSGAKVRLAAIFGWPMLLVGLLGSLGLRRKGSRLRVLTALAVVMVLCGSSLVMTGCAGPGIYQAVLTPASTTCTLGGSAACGYPITVTVSGAGLKATTMVYFVVSSPGIPGQE